MPDTPDTHRSVRRPTTADLDPQWRDLLRKVAARLDSAGHRAWLVGGAVRDLALGGVPKDIDLASAATPEEVEQLFEHTVPVGRTFGTVVILAGGRELQHTTFRTESGYSDQRRPDQVAYGTTLEEDARRRDFTCNALYLCPLDDAFEDPAGGLEDLKAATLRAVGEARERFREDGLRLVRMARFAARLDLEVAPEVLAAARESSSALIGVSSERCLGELERIFSAPRSGTALGLLVDCGLLPLAVPGASWALEPARARPRLGWLERLAVRSASSGPGLESGLALLLEPAGTEPTAYELAEAALADLHVSRATRRGVLARWRLLRELEVLLDAGVLTRAMRVRLVRDPDWAPAATLQRARLEAEDRDPAALDELEAFAAALPPDEHFPVPLLAPADLAAAGIASGPRYGALLAELEELRLDRRVTTPDEARTWLARRVAGS